MSLLTSGLLLRLLSLLACFKFNKTNRSNDATLENPLTFMFHSNVYMSKEFQGLFKELGGVSKELQGVSKEFNGAF